MIEINNASAKYRNIDKEFLKKVAKYVLSEENADNDLELSVALVNSSDIRALNKKYRDKDKATDVLSFGSIEEELPEIVICPEEVEKYSEGFLKKELARVLVHGILHVLGYDHEKTDKEAKLMFKKQEEYISKLSLD